MTLLKAVPLIKMQDRKKVQHYKVHVVQKRGLGISPKLKKGKSLIVGYPQIGLSPFLFTHVWPHVLRLPENKPTGFWENCQVPSKDE